MSYTKKELSPTKLQLTFSLGAGELKAARPAVVKKMTKDVKLAGFRAGKAPAALAEKQLDQATLEMHVAEAAVNAAMIEALEEEKIQPLDRPEVDVTQFDPGKKLEFTAEIEVVPSITLPPHTKLKAKKATVKVEKSEVDEVIERMRLGFSTKEAVERAAKKDDEAWIDFEGRDEKGELVPGASGQDYPLALGSGTFIPGFEEGVIGHQAGDVFDLPLTFPSDYHHKPLAGAKVTFKVTVKSVKEVALPKVDDEFAAKCGPFKTVAELRKDIERELQARKEQDAVNTYHNALISELVEKTKLELPKILVEDQMRSIERDAGQNAMYRGKQLDEALSEEGMTREQWQEKEVRPAAERRVATGLVLSELSKKLAITVSKEELENEIERLIAVNPSQKAEYDKPETRRDVANRVLTNKTLEALAAANEK